MADSKESFEILEDGSGNGVSPSASQIGDASAGKIGMTVFGFRDSSGVLRMPEVNGSNILRGDVTGTVSVSNTVSVTGPLTDAQLRATPVPISGTVTANAGTNLNTSALALEATQVTQNTRIGDLTEAAPATDTASSGLNGRLQRIAQRITSMITTLTDGTQRTRITDGTNNSEVRSTDPLTTSQGLVVRTVPYMSPTFTVTATDVILGNQKSLIAIQNTGTSVVRISKIYLTNTRTAATTGVVANIRLQRIASFTGGTALSSFPHNTLRTLPAGITFATGATFTSESALFRESFWSTDEWGPGTVDVEAQDHTQQEYQPWYLAGENEEPITLIQNQGLHVKCNTNTVNGQFTITIVFRVDPA